MSDNLTGLNLGQYELREMAVNGNIIAIYKAYQPKLKRFVAIQTLQPQLLKSNPEYLLVLRRAAELIAGFEHPNIVPILDYVEQDNVPYIVVRLLNGRSLRYRLRSGAFSLQDCLRVVQQIGNALEYIHSLGELHGDPSPGNILFDTWGSAYLSDFIIAGFMREANDGRVYGTLEYMSPERIDDETYHGITPASDQYALAAITYEMLTGHFVFEADSPSTIARMHLFDPPAPPQEHRPEIPLAVNEVLFRALAKKPEDRYPTVMDFAREFEKALSAAPQHLFISYSRRDKAFAQELREHLSSNGFTLWIDDAIEHGDQWFNQIHDAIKTCAAFLVIMTPDSEQSEWVQKEILLAKRYKKPIFPLLHDGDEFALLIDIQYADVRDGQMPGTDFHRRISRAVYGMG
ncbi:MAG TPA: TIR domain-containing protein [Phototrophicaceae bacterium]|nr:TIR domain-containing protein [Phototrophicaceae bacterium]